MSINKMMERILRSDVRSVLRELATTRTVRTGFTAFLVGAGLAVLALSVLLLSYTFEAHTDGYYTWTGISYALVMLSVPVTMVGIVLLLPTKRRRIGVAVAGLTVAAIATAGFVLAYPADWNRYGDDHTLYVVFVYAFGIAGLTVATGAALRSHTPQLIRAVTEINRSGSGDGEPITVGPRSLTDGVSHVSVDPRSGADGPSVVTLVVNGTSYAFGHGETFGRQDEPWFDDLVAACDGQETIQHVSKDHVEFSVGSGGVYVVDRGRNGTAVNGRQLGGERAKLADGDTLVLGDVAEIGVEL